MSRSHPIGVAVIGLGTVGLRYVEQFQLHDGFEVIGGFDNGADASALAADRFGIDTASDARSLIEDERVHFVYIAVPPLHHEYYVDLVLDANKAMLCEKPLGVDDAQSAGMVARVEAAGSPAAVNFVFGAAPSARLLIDRVGNEARSVSLRTHFEHWPRAWQAGATWLRERDQGGWVREVVSHYLFLLLRLFDDVMIEQAAVAYPDDGTSEQALVASLRCGDVAVQLFGTSDGAGPDEVVFTVRGAERSWRLVNWYDYEEAALDGEWELALDRSQSGGPAAYAAQLDQMARLVDGQAHTLATFAEGLRVQQLAEALLHTEAR